ncbi:HalOD1 output domain-containing protein [Halobacterium zhouii]|uniref:HalOD1 output domain-containing protein n=1 Tax=Halobacterium zhouii TaxID=2902624 RepID=UPI001E3EE37F|nr:HalOD1 output domain-containing protein [Halobacterium zhouii]
MKDNDHYSTVEHIDRVDWSGDVTPSTTIVEAVARARNCRPTDLESLDKTIDTDALNALFAPRHDGTQRGSGSISFSYSDRDVTVFSDGQIVVDES